jgi:hypothetical protein
MLWNLLTWSGGAAAALLAIGALLRIVFRRLLALGHWTAAVVRLPAIVADLSTSVGDLSRSVTDLSRSVDGLQHPHPAPVLHLESL